MPEPGTRNDAGYGTVAACLAHKFCVHAHLGMVDDCLPGIGAIVVEDVELARRDELAPIDARLDGAESSQNAHLFDVAHDRGDVKPLELRVDRVKTSDEVLEEQVERLRQADQLATVDVERGDASTTIVDQPTRVVLGVARRWRRTRRWPRRGPTVTD